MSRLLLPYPRIYLRLFKAFAICLAITSLLLFFPSLVYLFKLYLCITSFICMAVGRTDLYSFRTSLLISLNLLIFISFSMYLRYLVICACHHTLITPEFSEFWMTHGTGWKPTMSCSLKHLTYPSGRVSSKELSLFFI